MDLSVPGQDTLTSAPGEVPRLSFVFPLALKLGEVSVAGTVHQWGEEEHTLPQNTGNIGSLEPLSPQ